MTTQEVANRLVEICRSGNWAQAYEELYHEDCVSIEPAGAPWEMAKGMNEIHQKGEKFNEMVEEMHGGSVSDPLVAGNFITLTMEMDVTYKGAPRKKDSEVCVYEVQNGKIVKEQFFYPIG